MTNPRITLALTNSDDWNLYRALYTSKSVMAAIGPVLRASAAATQFEQVLKHNAMMVPGHRTWTIKQRADGSSIGIVALLRRNAGAEIGIMLLPHAQGQQIARSAFGLLLPYAFDVLDLDWVRAGSRMNLDRLLLPFGFQRVADASTNGTCWRVRSTELRREQLSAQ